MCSSTPSILDTVGADLEVHLREGLLYSALNRGKPRMAPISGVLLTLLFVAVIGATIAARMAGFAGRPACILILLSCGSVAFAATKERPPASVSYDLPIEKVYAAVLQVASADYNLKYFVKEGHTASFYTGGQYSLVLTAICRPFEGNKTMVSLTVSQAENNPQLFFVVRSMDREANRFWSELDNAVQTNETLQPGSQTPQGAMVKEAATVSIKSTPDGADIILDGKFVGSTPSTLSLESGDHQVQVKASGFKVWEKSLSIASEGQITLNAHLEPDSADTPK